jgi:hypothetical protein
MNPSLLPLREKVDRRASAETDEGFGAKLEHPSSDLAFASLGSATFSLKGRREGAPGNGPPPSNITIAAKLL